MSQHPRPPRNTAFNAARIDQRYMWYWRDPESYYYPMWEDSAPSGAALINHHGAPVENAKPNAGALAGGMRFGHKSYGSGVLGAKTDTERVDFGNFDQLEVGSGIPFSFWAGFQFDDFVDDNAIWSKWGVGNTRQMLLRVDGGTDPQEMELWFDGANVFDLTSSPATTQNIHQEQPYLVLLTNDGAANCTLDTINLDTQEVVDDRLSGSSSNNADRDHIIELGARNTGADDTINGVIFAAGIMMNHLMTKEEFLLLAKDIYGPIRPRKRAFGRAPVAITDGELVAAATSFDNRPHRPATIFVPS